MTTSTIHQFETQNHTIRHLVVLPVPHEDVLRFKEKLVTFQDRGWQVKDFGAFGAFEWGFILIEIEEFEGYSHFKRDICCLVEQGLKYVYPEHIVCWL